MHVTRIFLAALCYLVTSTEILWAHDPGLSEASISRSQRGWSVRLSFSRSDLRGIEPLEEIVAREVHFSSHGTILPLEIRHREDVDGVHVEIELPAGRTGALVFEEPLLQRLPRGHRQFVRVLGLDGEVLAEALLDAERTTLAIPARATQASSRVQLATDFVRVGAVHILQGYDHLLFLLGLLVVGTRLRETIGMVTAFTIAHSLTLALVVTGFLAFPSELVEPLIAASLVYLGLQNLFSTRMGHRPALTFAFGLIHGMGFASALMELRVGTGYELIVPLLAFNTGVELGQLSVVLVVLPLIWRARHLSAYPRISAAASWIVASAGAFWLVQRVLV